MKGFTDLEQSKILEKILPLESADMVWISIEDDESFEGAYEALPKGCSLVAIDDNTAPCWSFTALLCVLPKEVEIDGQHYAPCLFPIQDKWLLKLWYNSNHTITSPIAIFSDNPVDACYEMVLKLHEQKLL